MIKTHKLNKNKFAALFDVKIFTFIPYVLYISVVKVGSTSTMYSLYISPYFNLSVVIPKRKDK